MTGRWLPKGGVAELRRVLAPTRDELAKLEALPPPAPDSFPVQFADAVHRREVELARAADAKARANAHRARVAPLERTIQARIVSALERRGWTVKRRGVSLERREGRVIRHGDPGEADLEVLPGRGLTVFLEVKRPGTGRVSEAQAKWLERRRAEGYVAEVVTTVDEAIAAVETAIGGRGP